MKKNKKNNLTICEHLYVADFETTTEAIYKDKSKVYIAGLLNVSNNKIQYSYTLEEWVGQVLKLPSSSQVYFHNLSFDGEFIIHHLLKNNFEPIDGHIKIEDRKPKLLSNKRLITPTALFSVLQDGSGRIYQITVEVKNQSTKKWKKIIFKCSYNLVNLSLENWAKALNLKTQKQTLDYNKYRDGDPTIKTDKDLHNYLKADLLIVSEGLKIIYSKITNQGKNKRLFALTAASVAMKTFKLYLEKEKININPNHHPTSINENIKKLSNYDILFNWRMNNWTIEEHSLITSFFYRGGFTNGNQRIIDQWVKTRSGISLDVNSLYPSVMKNFKAPAGKKLTLTEIKKNNIKEFYTFKLINIISFNPKNENNPDILKNVLDGKTRLKYDLKNKRYISEWNHPENYIIGFLEEELNFLKKHYNIKYKILKTFYTAKTDTLCEYIKIKEHLKINAQNPEEKFIEKLTLNSLYGKFGQKATRESLRYEEDTKNNINDIDYSSGNSIYRRTYTPKVEEKNLSYPLVATVITALARIELYKAIFENLENWLYSDTDSCYFSDTPKNIDIDNTKFGAWKVEKEFSEFKWIRPKCYSIKNIKTDKHEFTVSGLNKKAVEQLTRENFKRGLSLQTVKLMKKRVPGGIILIESDYTIKANEFLCESVKETKKKIKKENPKKGIIINYNIDNNMNQLLNEVR